MNLADCLFALRQCHLVLLGFGAIGAVGPNLLVGHMIVKELAVSVKALSMMLMCALCLLKIRVADELRGWHRTLSWIVQVHPTIAPSLCDFLLDILYGRNIVMRL